MKSTVLLICRGAAVCLLATKESKSDEQGKDAPPSQPTTSDQFTGNEAGQVRDDNGLKMKLVWCPPGDFTMENVEVIKEPDAEKDGVPNDDGLDPNNEPPPKPRSTTRIMPVKVVLTQGYWLGKFEVTQAEWKQLMGSEPWKGQLYTKEGADFPATWVSWTDASDFCHKLTDCERHTGRLPNGWEYTLPTEAQRERACRAQTEARFSFGDDELKLGDYAWFWDNAVNAGELYAHSVGQKKPNLWGFFDLHGNVWEWCRDIYTEKLPGGRDPEVKPDAQTDRSIRVLRGGGINDRSEDCRSTVHGGRLPPDRRPDQGFRVALSPSGNK